MFNNNQNPGRSEEVRNYIVFLEDEPGNGLGTENRVQAILRSLDIDLEPNQIFENLGGFTVSITETQAKRLKALSDVKTVDQDAEVTLNPPDISDERASNPIQEAIAANSLQGFSDNYATESGETQPWGVSAVWQSNDISTKPNPNIGQGTYAFVADTGISSAYSNDLNIINNNFHRSFITRGGPSEKDPLIDGNGHGTHVAGTIGAMINGSGVIGVAPGANLIALKVLGSNGSGTYSGIIEGMDYAAGLVNADNKINSNNSVINMSLGGGLNDSFNAAVRRTAASLPVVVAAGNEEDDADNYSPSSAGEDPNVFSISAVDKNYFRTWWSNFDQNDGTDSDGLDDVDFAAPGLNILSVNGTSSGTSMAAPHAAGLILIGGIQPGPMVSLSGLVDDSTADPFALAVISEPPSEPPTDTATYSINLSSSTVNEGESVTINLNTTNVGNNTTLYWNIEGQNITPDDFQPSTTPLSGTFLINDNTAEPLEIVIASDLTTEGPEEFTFTVFTDEANQAGSFAVETSVNIVDTSTTLGEETDDYEHWGTNGNDTVTGTSGDNLIGGVSKDGTDTGRNTIDVLIGDPPDSVSRGADIFVLGDASRGVFYNYGSKRSSGRSDYALITDFEQTKDKLQVVDARYAFSSVNGNTEVYLRQGRSNELIAILEGVELTLTENDFLVI